MTHPIEKWFSGKALKIVQEFVLPTLATAAELGYWPKGASRKVTAALNKQAPALKFAKANERRVHQDGDEGRLEDVFDVRGDLYFKATIKPTYLVHAMMFGSVSHAPEMITLADKLVPFCVNDAERAALATARAWVADFAPVAELVALLDSRKPVPVVVCKTLSPLVLANLGKSLAVNLETIAPAPVKYVWETRVRPDGTSYQVAVPTLDWPAGTKHNMSRFAKGTAHNAQCHACGHAIKNPFNWVPLLCTTPTGPVSLWTGKDCAVNLFNCDVSGEADWSEARTAA